MSLHFYLYWLSVTVVLPIAKQSKTAKSNLLLTPTILTIDVYCVINFYISVKKIKPKPKRFGDKVLIFPQQNKNNFVQYKVPAKNKSEF